MGKQNQQSQENMKRYADRNWKKAVDGNWKYNKKHHVDYFMRSYHQMIWGPRHKTSPLMGSIILSLSVNGQVPKCNANDWKPYQNQNHVMRPPDHQSKHFTVARSLRQRLLPFGCPLSLIPLSFSFQDVAYISRDLFDMVNSLLYGAYSTYSMDYVSIFYHRSFGSSSCTICGHLIASDVWGISFAKQRPSNWHIPWTGGIAGHIPALSSESWP